LRIGLPIKRLDESTATSPPGVSQIPRCHRVKAREKAPAADDGVDHWDPLLRGGATECTVKFGMSHYSRGEGEDTNSRRGSRRRTGQWDFGAVKRSGWVRRIETVRYAGSRKK